MVEAGKVDFEGFCEIVSHFLEEEDADAMQAELKEAFRLYDKEGKFIQGGPRNRTVFKVILFYFTLGKKVRVLIYNNL